MARGPEDGENLPIEDSELVVDLHLSDRTLESLYLILIGTVSGRMLVSNTLGATNKDSTVINAAVPLLNRIIDALNSRDEVATRIRIGLSGGDIDLLNTRILIWHGLGNHSIDANDALSSAFIEMNREYINAGYNPRPDYADYVSKMN